MFYIFRETVMKMRGCVQFKASPQGVVFYKRFLVVMVMFEMLSGRLRLQTYRKDRPIG